MGKERRRHKRGVAQDAAIPAFKTLDSMEARVQGCTTCHGQSGQGTGNDYFPRIAGKPAGYLFNQLVAFRDGKRIGIISSEKRQYLDKQKNALFNPVTEVGIRSSAKLDTYVVLAGVRGNDIAELRVTFNPLKRMLVFWSPAMARLLSLLMLGMSSK